jgi:hypothetical protein
MLCKTNPAFSASQRSLPRKPAEKLASIEAKREWRKGPSVIATLPFFQGQVKAVPQAGMGFCSAALMPAEFAFFVVPQKDVFH